MPDRSGGRQPGREPARAPPWNPGDRPLTESSPGRAEATGYDRFSREMSITHREFLRTLPPAVDGADFSVNENVVQVGSESRGLRIELGPERERRIASLSLPITDVRFCFTGYSEQEVRQFMQRFDLYFRRGGG